MVPDTAKPTTLELCRAECVAAWLVQKVQSVITCCGCGSG